MKSSFGGALQIASLAVAASASVVLCGCSSGGGGGGGIGGGDSHQSVALLDHLGQPLAVDSTAPYSPRQTCGACHDVDEVANGYHFQQGRTDMNGDIVVAENYFADGRSYVQSPGMYGKW